ncbi:MAG: hypothetical protein RJQ09_11835, partial [Cyclobacteriaceae bacterium]
MRISRIIIIGFALMFGCGEDEVNQDDRGISKIIELSTPIKYKRLFPEGNKLYLTTDFSSNQGAITEVYLFDLTTFDLEKLLTEEGFGKATISNDRTVIATSTFINQTNGFEVRISLHDLSKNSKRTLISSNEHSIAALAFSPNHKYLLYDKYIDSRNTIRRLNIENGEDLQLSGEGNAVYIDYSEVLDLLLIDTYSEFYFMDWEGEIKSKKVSELKPIMIAQDGITVLCKKNGEVFLYNAQTTEINQITNLGVDLNPVTIAKDGKTILLSTDKDHLDSL